MPEICRFMGIVLYMYFADHNAPHIHIKYGSNKCIIYIKDRTVDGKMSMRVLKLVNDWIDLHEKQLLDMWNDAKNFKQLNKLEPLR